MKYAADVACDEFSAELYARQINELFIGMVSASAYHTSDSFHPQSISADPIMAHADAFDVNAEPASLLAPGPEYVDIGVTLQIARSLCRLDYESIRLYSCEDYSY